MREVMYLSKPSFIEAIKRNQTNIDTIHYNNETFVSLFLNNPVLKERLIKNNSFYIKTHGCQANIRDEESIAGLLSSLGLKRIDNQNEASCVPDDKISEIPISVLEDIILSSSSFSVVEQKLRDYVSSHEDEKKGITIENLQILLNCYNNE